MKKLMISAFVLLMAGCMQAPQTDLEGLKGMRDVFQSALDSKDPTAVASIYTEDAAMLVPNSETINGRADIEAFWGGSFAAGIGGEGQDTEVYAQGDVGYTVGTFTVTDAGGATIDEGNYMEIWRHVDGNWRLHRNIWNSSLPLAAPESEADVEALHSVREAHDGAVNAGDLDAYLAVSAEDVVLMPPNEPPVVGKEAFRAWAQGLFGQFSFEETMSSEEVVVTGDWGFDSGTYTIRPTPKVAGEAAEGTSIEQSEIGRELDYAQTGKYLWILKKQPDGSWKIARGMWSSNHPPPGT